MNNQTKIGIWLEYKYPTCHNCGFLWKIKLSKINDIIKEEFAGFNRTSIINQENKIQKITHICLNCNYSFSQDYKIMTEDEFLKRLTANEKQIDLNSLTSNSEIINKTISGKDLNSEKINDIIKQIEENL